MIVREFSQLKLTNCTQLQVMMMTTMEVQEVLLTCPGQAPGRSPWWCRALTH